MSITFTGIEHAYDDQVVLHGVDLDIGRGEIMALLGPSGSGKTTLLRLAAGLEPLQSGAIDLPGQRVTPSDCPAPEARPTCLVFQQHALFPHLNVAENVAFGLDDRGGESSSARVTELLERAGLAGLEARYPHTLSGGQQQRVALARALAPAPAVMLLDEPFASVDVLLVRQLREEARLLLKDTETTTLLVTHDPEDALRLADRIAVIVDGRIVQVGTPEALWNEPAHPFVAEVLAGRQMLDGTWRAGRVQTPFGELTVPALAGAGEGSVVRVAVDPAAMTVVAAEKGRGQVTDVRFAGRKRVLRIEAEGAVLHVEIDAEAETGAAGPPSLSPGDRVDVDFAPTGLLVYN